MLKNKNIICISSIDWDFVWQGHQEIMSTFARNGNRVLFIENTGVRTPSFRDIPRLRKRIINWNKSLKGFRRELDNLFIYSPLVLPFPYSRIVRYFNRYMLLKPLKRWIRIMKFYDPIIWTFLPTGTTLDIINNIESDLVIYYCIADFSKLVSNSKKINRTEDALLKRCDLVFAQGQTLKERCAQLNNNVHIFPFGVRIEDFNHFQQPMDKAREDIKNIKKPIIGYVGGIHRHIDFELLKSIAQENLDWSIVLIGPLQTDISAMAGLKNVFFLGQKEFSELPSYINEFTVGIIPYVKSEYTQTVYPTKLNEYLALGKPVISTNIPEVTRINLQDNDLVSVADTGEEFIKNIWQAIQNPGSREIIAKRITYAKSNSWARRIEEMSCLIEDAFEKKTGIPVNWKEKLIELYKITAGRAIKTVAIALCSYVIVFYTPLMWFLAEPLKIMQNPQKADCIVVFAGGVGESGRAGQGYEERVSRAIDLYQKGYADQMIFSSGYKYFFEETSVMMAIAVSLKIPKSAIILEDKAANTYENVKFTKEILDNKKMNSILLVSSPYNMRRAKLVFEKIAKNIKIIYVPVTNSLYYAHPDRDLHGKKIWKRINLEQIKGIAHEYLGILYYWLKGWV